MSIVRLEQGGAVSIGAGRSGANAVFLLRLPHGYGIIIPTNCGLKRSEMEYKLLEEQDLGWMPDFVDDNNTEYRIEDLKREGQSGLYRKGAGQDRRLRLRISPDASGRQKSFLPGCRRRDAGASGPGHRDRADGVCTRLCEKHGLPRDVFVHKQKKSARLQMLRKIRGGLPRTAFSF